MRAEHETTTLTLSNSCACQDERGEPADCGGDCYDAGLDLLYAASDAWVERNPSKHGYLIEGRGMGWRQEAGARHWGGQEPLEAVIGAVGPWTQRYTFGPDQIEISQSHRDAVAEHYTVRVKGADQA
jgi:hypothetical protein